MLEKANRQEPYLKPKKDVNLASETNRHLSLLHKLITTTVNDYKTWRPWRSRRRPRRRHSRTTWIRGPQVSLCVCLYGLSRVLSPGMSALRIELRGSALRRGRGAPRSPGGPRGRGRGPFEPRGASQRDPLGAQEPRGASGRGPHTDELHMWFTMQIHWLDCYAHTLRSPTHTKFADL